VNGFARARFALIAPLLVGLWSCSLIDEGPYYPGAAYPGPARAAEQTVERIMPPLPRSRFVLEDDGQDVIGEVQLVRARYEDTFVDVARAYGLGFDELVHANPGVDPWLPGTDTVIVLPTRYILPDAPREGIVLNIAAKRLFYFPPRAADGERVVWTYPIGIGREGWQTPTGSTTIVSRARDPVWYVPASVRQEYAAEGRPVVRQIPPGPDNPLGHYVLGLGIPGYLIHGTNKPAGVGMRISHGCVRLFPEDIEQLYSAVPLGLPVHIVNQPFLVGWLNDELYLEVHPPLQEDRRPWREIIEEELAEAITARGRVARRPDPDRLQQIIESGRGFPVAVFGPGADAADALLHARRVENVVSYSWFADKQADGQPAPN